MRAKLANLAWLLAASCALAASPSAYTGRSWKDPPLGKLLTQADLVAECRVIVGGQFSAIVHPERVFFRREAGEAPSAVTVEGFNSYEWNTAYYTMREGDTLVLVLFTPGGGTNGTYTLATPSSGRFPVDKGRVLARLGRADFLVEIPAGDFRAALDAYFLVYRTDAHEAAQRLGDMIAAESLETRYLAIVLLGELPERARAMVAGLLAPLARDENPAVREVAARSLGRAGGPEAARALATFLTDADHVVARAAAAAVVEAKSPGAGRELVAWLARVAVQEEIEAEKKPGGDAVWGKGGKKWKNYRVQGEAFQFLADGKWLRGASFSSSGGEGQAVTHGLVEMIASGGRGRATLAARVLGRLGVKEAVPELIRLLGAESQTLRGEAGAALVAITMAPETAARSRALEWWQKHKDEPRRKWLEQGLARAADALGAGTYEGDTEGRLLVAVSRSPVAAWAVRRKLAEGTGWPEAPFGYMKGPLIAPFAERALTVGTASQRLGAAKALAEIVKDLSPLLTFHEAMLFASYDTDSEVRAEAVEALGEMHESRAVKRLIDLIERGSSKAEKTAAAEALRKITGKRFGFYVSRGYDLAEELRPLELWNEWRERGGRTGGGRVHALPRPAPSRWEEKLGSADPAVWTRRAGLIAHCSRALSDVIRELAESDNPRVRGITAAALGLGARSTSAEVLGDLLDDAEPFVRVQAAWALGSSLRGTGEPPARLVKIAREALPEKEAETDENAEPPETAEEGGGDEGGGKVLDDNTEPPPPPSIVGPWAGFDIKPPQPPLRVLQAVAIRALGKIGGADSLDVLREALQNGGTGLQCEAVAALAHFPGRGALGRGADDLLCIAIKEGDSSVRKVAARALAMRKPPGAAAAMIRAIAPVDYWDSYTLLDALTEVTRPEDAGALAAHLTPENEGAAAAAAYALIRTPGREAASALVNALETCGASTRYYATRALMKLGQKHAEGGFPDSGLTAELRVRATKALVKQLEETEFLYASYAAQALEQVGVPGLPGTADALFIYRRSWKPQDPRAMGAILKLAGGRGCRYALGLLEDGTWSDKYYTLQALHYQPTSEAVEKLIDVWRDPESPFQAVAARSLRKCGRGAVEALAGLLGRERDAGLRRRAGRLLGGIGREARAPGVTSAVAASLAGVVNSEDPVLAWLADRELAALTGGGASLGPDSTEGERASAAVRWRRLLGSKRAGDTGGETRGEAAPSQVRAPE